MSVVKPHEDDDIFRGQHSAKQNPVAPPVASDMAVFLATYPPLGQVTKAKQLGTVIHAILEVPKDLATEPWQLLLWHCNGEGGWTETTFVSGELDNYPPALDEADKVPARLYFTSKIAVTSSVNFTVKFRQSPSHDWRWIRGEQGLDDGTVVLDSNPAQDSDAKDLPDLIRFFNRDLKWKSVLSQTPRTRLWSIEIGVKGAEKDESAIADVSLGIPWLGGSLR